MARKGLYKADVAYRECLYGLLGRSNKADLEQPLFCPTSIEPVEDKCRRRVKTMLQGDASEPKLVLHKEDPLA